MPDFPEIETKRLTLRAFRADDLPYLQAFAVRPAFWRFLPGPELSADLLEAFLAQAMAEAANPARRDWPFCVAHRERALCIGSGRLSITNPEHGQGSVAVSLDSDYWGQGFGAEALAALCDLGFEGLGLHRLSAVADAENAAAHRMLEACGFQHEGTLRGHLQLRGQWRDSRLYARLAP